MPQISAGLLMYRRRSGQVQVLLVHPGGPFWKNKDAGAWTIPKGAPIGQENLLDTARREFEEETGFNAGDGPFTALAPIRQKAGKTVHAWAFEGDCDPAQVRSNQFEIEWPPRSGKRISVPEVDRAEFMSLEVARAKINPAQVAFLDELVRVLA
jgi:predicted NUDIX family NTP pyrophosphohydrolase